MMNLAELRKLKGNTANAQKILESLQEKSGKGDQDDRFWKLSTDKAGNGSATIRFLPNKDPNELHWAKYHSHSFKTPAGKWYIENCPTTNGEPCPACEANKELWETEVKANRDTASARKRKLNYVFNIMVIKDPSNSENEGKVFLFRAGKTIFDMIMAKRQPEDEDEVAVDVFDLWEGANLKLKIHKEAGYPKYTKSSWSPQSAVAEDDEEILAIMNKTHDVAELVDKKNFKAYDQLKKRLDSVVKGSSVGTAEDGSDDDGNMDDGSGEEEVSTPKAKAASKAAKSKPAPTPVADDDDEDLSALFNSISEED